VAEGVEDRDGWNILRAFGCDQAQGFLISRPLAADRFIQWLRRQPQLPLMRLPSASMPKPAADDADLEAILHTFEALVFDREPDDSTDEDANEDFENDRLSDAERHNKLPLVVPVL
jgi:hypothetical protein